MEKKTYSYYGNTVTKDGKIFNAKGKELIISARGTVMIRVDGKKHIYKAGRVVYEAITGVQLTDPHNMTNGLKEYILVLQTRTDYFKGKKWGTEKYSEEIRNAIVEDYNKKGTAHVSYRQLAEKYGCSCSTIRMYLRKSREEAKAKNEKTQFGT